MPTEWTQVDPLCRRRNLVVGERIHHVIVEFQAGGIGKTHRHPHEQTTYVLSGRARYQVGNEVRELVAGDVVLVPGDTDHGMTALEATVLLDTFSPPREEFLSRP